MANIFWYYCLAAIGTGLVVFTIYKKRNLIDLLSFFLFAAALAYLLEVVVLFALKSYSYKPGIFSDPNADDILGHLIANGSYWGGFALLVAAFSLSYGWILLISVYFMLTEILFIKLGIYTHHWWKLYMTGIGTFVFLSVVRKLFLELKKKQNKFLRYFTFYFIAWLLLLGPSVVLLLFGKQHFSMGLVPNMYRDDILFDAPYHLVLSFVYIFFINFLQKWYWKVAPFFIILLSDSILVSMNILIFQDDWNLFYLTIIRSIGLSLYIILEKHSLNCDIE